MELLLLKDESGVAPSFNGLHLEEMDRALSQHPDAIGAMCVVQTLVEEEYEATLYYTMLPDGSTTTTFRADVPEDIEDTPEYPDERYRIARTEMEHVVPEYMMPANWELHSDDGRVVAVTRYSQYNRRFR